MAPILTVYCTIMHFTSPIVDKYEDILLLGDHFFHSDGLCSVQKFNARGLCWPCCRVRIRDLNIPFCHFFGNFR